MRGKGHQNCRQGKPEHLGRSRVTGALIIEGHIRNQALHKAWLHNEYFRCNNADEKRTVKGLPGINVHGAVITENFR